MKLLQAAVGIGVLAAGGVLHADSRADAVKDLGTALAGSWKCAGSGVKGTATFKINFDGHWLGETLDLSGGGTKTGVETLISFDPRSKTYREVGVDRDGADVHGDGKLSGKKLDFELDRRADGADGKERAHLAWDDKTLTLAGERAADGKTWTKAYEVTCQKGGLAVALAMMGTFADKMCSCKDKGCGDKVNDAMTKYFSEMAKDQTQDKPSESDVKAATDIMMRYTTCQTKLATGKP